MFLINFYRKIFRKLFPEKTNTDFPGGYIPNRFFTELIKSGPVLIVGDYTGRDYKPLKEKIGDVYLLDVVDNGIAEDAYFINQSITEKTPFSGEFFNYVIISEVIEHLWEDKKALEEIHRILKSDGKLLLSVPFYNDFPDYHYHIYSPKTILILLKHSGFSVVEKQYRGLVVSIPNEIIAFFALLLFPFFRKGTLLKVNRFLYKAHEALSMYKGLNGIFRFNRILKGNGVIIMAEKSREKVDPITIQQKSFSVNKNL